MLRLSFPYLEIHKSVWICGFIGLSWCLDERLVYFAETPSGKIRLCTMTEGELQSERANVLHSTLVVPAWYCSLSSQKQQAVRSAFSVIDENPPVICLYYSGILFIALQLRSACAWTRLQFLWHGH